MNRAQLQNIIENILHHHQQYISQIKDICKYGAVSFLALAADVGLLWIMVEYAKLYYLYATSLAFICGLIVNYSLVKLFVFKKSKMHPLKEFIWYSLIGLIGLGLNDLIMYVLVLLNLWYMYAKAISVALVFFFHFFARRSLFEH